MPPSSLSSMVSSARANARSASIPAELFEVTYLYRDPSNYKFWGTFVLRGEFKIDELSNYLVGSECFVPTRIGLPSLVPDPCDADDHDLHEFGSVTLLNDGAADYLASDFAQLIIAANDEGWFRGC
ncbi:MAG: hypothetical protein K2Y29_02835 [Beijerinckiaceae bacterium]|nr:hypothetical protein [Beijerinckiaceae bacterium]